MASASNPRQRAGRESSSAEPTTLSEIPVKREYTADDLRDFDPAEQLGTPGNFPYTRGIKSSGYRQTRWTMRQFAGFKTAKDTNERFKYLLEHGQTGLSTAFDLPTLMGVDSDDAMAEGEVGREGVAIDSLADFEILFKGIDLAKASTSMTINLPAPILLAMYLSVADQQGVPYKRVRGTLQLDILKEYIAQNEYLYPPEPSMRLVLDTIEFCTKEVPRYYPISISGYHIREAGADAVQELAFTLADGVDYVERMVARGHDVDAFARRLSFFFDVHNNFFEEIAKLRAGRRIWARFMRDTMGAKNPMSWMLPMHCQTAGVSLTAQQPLNNLARVSWQALAGVLGGTQSLHTNSFDEALALPTDEAVRLALRTQQVIGEESGVCDTVDPFGGSFFVEALTNEIESRALDIMKKIKDLGGVVPAIEKGYFHREIAETAYRFEVDLGKRRRKIVGVNIHAVEGDKPEIMKIDNEVEAGQVRALKKLRRDRDNAAVEAALAKVRETARGDSNLLPPILTAVKAYATVGEVTNALKEVFGELPAFRG
ncbi:MAG: methylmalonyl-CoA mutase [Elusimicrobia bacterium CG_4_9_14_3_um_filter_62_55]|nr:MAG: methylmalonyl-CoA mutase [Elusimicrobia bacterium CG22_combo_CG10-13_8_21_14_all_63_91]PJA12308.1 MAG: methylmalonyl-CoA mutase [Elusimicrobia bacterium CG_4_10_14_0_2_um_filter_63_34]PJB24740.1 MAG: methylmalonyl-CoA mutase [Elusimicrobia bacterium CG_4_9_14_3_um_filter_62_55]